MDLPRFKHLLGVYGADLSRWSSADSMEGEELMHNSSEAKLCYADVAQLDVALGQVDVPDCDADLQRRIVNEAVLHEQVNSHPVLLFLFSTKGMTLVAASILLVSLFISGVHTVFVTPEPVTVVEDVSVPKEFVSAPVPDTVIELAENPNGIVVPEGIEQSDAEMEAFLYEVLEDDVEEEALLALL